MLLVKWQKKKTLKLRALAVLQAVVKHRVDGAVRADMFTALRSEKNVACYDKEARNQRIVAYFLAARSWKLAANLCNFRYHNSSRSRTKYSDR